VVVVAYWFARQYIIEFFLPDFFAGYLIVKKMLTILNLPDEAFRPTKPTEFKVSVDVNTQQAVKEKDISIRFGNSGNIVTGGAAEADISVDVETHEECVDDHRHVA
jgi:hypothetical protein